MTELGYDFFWKEQNNILLDENPFITNSSLKKEINKRWNCLTQNEIENYKNKEQKFNELMKQCYDMVKIKCTV